MNERYAFSFGRNFNMAMVNTGLIFLKMGFTPCKAEQPLRGMGLQKKKRKKIKACRKSI